MTRSAWTPEISSEARENTALLTTTDASGRKGRSITNALGQLLRVDEPTATGGTEATDLGSLATPHQPTIYTYDACGKMVRVQQGVQNRYFKYDSLGRLIRVNQPEQEFSTALTMSDEHNPTWHALANGFNDPKYLAVRNPSVLAAASDVMASGAAIFNTPLATYNLAAWGVNTAGGNLPYSPTLSPDENTSGGAKLFFYGTNAAMALQGGASAVQGVRSFFSLEGATNLASSTRTAHILAGDAAGGGHAWFRSWQSTKNGLTGAKDMFPITWRNRKIMTAVSEVATSPSSRWIQQSGRTGSLFENSGRPAKFLVEGVYANRRISVVVRGDYIITAW